MESILLHDTVVWADATLVPYVHSFCPPARSIEVLVLLQKLVGAGGGERYPIDLYVQELKFIYAHIEDLSRVEAAVQGLSLIHI